jgi:hypothetical protein
MIAMRSQSKPLPNMADAYGLDLPALIYRFAPASSREGGGGEPSSAPGPTGREDLPYKVEIWDEAKLAVEQVIAVTASGSIGYAAYYAATREFPNRRITLRHKNRIMSQWDGSEH